MGAIHTLVGIAEPILAAPPKTLADALAAAQSLAAKGDLTKAASALVALATDLTPALADPTQAQNILKIAQSL